MIGVFTMLVSLKDFMLRIPIVRMLMDHKHEQERTVDLIRELNERQEEYRQRVQVLDWMTYPHTHKRNNPHDNH